MVKKGALKVIKPRKERKSSLLKFPEVQGIVNLELKLYIAVNDSSYTKIGDITGVSKARFSEMKIEVTKGSGKFVHELSQSVLDPLIGRGIVPLEKIENYIDVSDPKKAQWLARKKLDRDIELLQGRNKPVIERIREVIDQMKKEAGID